MAEQNSLVLLSSADGIARIRFNRPAALNAIDVALAQNFLEALRRVSQSPDVRVVVIDGVGKAFMAGGDLASFHADLAAAPDIAKAIIDPLHEALCLMTTLPQPVIGALRGAVAGAGVGIALACDLAIAADTTRFAMAYSRIGTSLDAGCSWLLPRVVGLRKAMELSLLADPLDAAGALNLLMVNRVVKDSELEAEIDLLAQRVASGPTLAYGQIKKLLLSSHASALREHLDAEREAFRVCAATEDFSEGINAFFEKRQAVFHGR